MSFDELRDRAEAYEEIMKERRAQAEREDLEAAISARHAEERIDERDELLEQISELLHENRILRDERDHLLERAQKPWLT